MIFKMFARVIPKRSICTSSACFGKKNFKKFPIPNKRGTRIYKEQLINSTDEDIQVDLRGARLNGYWENGKFYFIPEMVPDIIVPDLTDFNLKPYVSYRTPTVVEAEFTPLALFNAVYASKIAKDLKENKLNEDLSPIEPSEQEKLTAEEAKANARKCGADMI